MQIHATDLGTLVISQPSTELPPIRISLNVAVGGSLPAGGSVGQILRKGSSAPYDVEWSNDQDAQWGSVTGTITAQADLMALLAAKQSVSGMSNYLTLSQALAGYYPLNNPAGYITASAVDIFLTPSEASAIYQTQANMVSYITDAEAAIKLAPICYPRYGNPENYATESWVTGRGYAQLSGATFTGKLLTTQTATTAPLNIGFLASVPTTTVAGDVWIGDNLNFKDKNGTSKLVANSSTQNTFSQPQVIAPPSNATLPALRITNTAAVNSFVVEDETNPDSTPFIIGSDGRVGIHGAPATNTAHKLAIYNGNVVFSQGFGLAFGDGTTQVTASTPFDPTGYATESWVTGQGYSPLNSPALSGNVSITSNSSSPALVITQDGTGDIVQFKDVASDTTYSFIDQFGKVNTIASTTANAGFSIPQGVAPTTPQNGDIWTTSGGLFYRLNGATFSTVNAQTNQTIGGDKTFTGYSSFTGIANFSNPVNYFGHSLVTSSTRVASANTQAGHTKSLYLGIGGVTGSTTEIFVGANAGGASTTTLYGTTNGVTVDLSDNSTKLATTAFVKGQSYLTTANLAGYAQLSGASFTGKVFCTAVAGNAGLNIGIGGTEPASTTSGDIWIPSGSNGVINYRDGGGTWRNVLANNLPNSIDINTATVPALRITQRGGANALVVEDSTSPDATAFVIDSFGKVGIGTAPDATAAIKIDGNGMSFNGLVVNPTSVTGHGGGGNTNDLLITINGVQYAIALRAV